MTYPMSMKMSNFTFTNLPELSVQSEVAVAVEEYNEPTQKTMSI